MKPIILNLSELSDSREVYESKPTIIIPLFIYGILGMLMIALIWMYFGHIDVVVKSEGMIRPNNQVGTIVNTYGGTLLDVKVLDGDYVDEGDILYVIEHKEVLAELEYFENQLYETNESLVMLNKYKNSIEEEVNYFINNEREEEYFLKFQGYMINYELAKKNSSFTMKERELKLESTISDLADSEARLQCMKKLKDSINQNRNLLMKTGIEKEYYNLYQKYINDYNAVIEQFKKVEMDIDSSTTEQGLLDKMDYYNEMLEELELLKLSIEDEENYFDNITSYSLQYDEYINRMEELNDNYQQTKENYEINKLLKGLAVTEWDVEQSKLTMEEAKRGIETYQDSFLGNVISKITEVENNLKELTLTKDNTKSKELLYKLNENEKKAAIENYQLKYVIDLNNNINSQEDSIEALKLNKNSLELQKDTEYYIDSENGLNGNLVEYRNNELRTTIVNIDNYHSKKRELEANIEKLNAQVNSAVVKATKSGVINTNVDLVKGDVLTSGLEVLTIIPEDDTKYKVNIYVSNSDIGKLKVGMEVKINIYALPNNDYGYVYGKITSISKDLKVDSNNTSGYYLAQASLNETVLYNSKGEELALKAGMACQAQMITESKSILRFVLEKIDLWLD